MAYVPSDGNEEASKFDEEIQQKPDQLFSKLTKNDKEIGDDFDGIVPDQVQINEIDINDVDGGGDEGVGNTSANKLMSKLAVSIRLKIGSQGLTILFYMQI